MITVITVALSFLLSTQNILSQDIFSELHAIDHPSPSFSPDSTTHQNSIATGESNSSSRSISAQTAGLLTLMRELKSEMMSQTALMTTFQNEMAQQTLLMQTITASFSQNQEKLTRAYNQCQANLDALLARPDYREEKELLQRENAKLREAIEQLRNNHENSRTVFSQLIHSISIPPEAPHAESSSQPEPETVSIPSHFSEHESSDSEALSDDSSSSDDNDEIDWFSSMLLSDLPAGNDASEHVAPPASLAPENESLASLPATCESTPPAIALPEDIQNTSQPSLFRPARVLSWSDQQRNLSKLEPESALVHVSNYINTLGNNLEPEAIRDRTSALLWRTTYYYKLYIKRLCTIEPMEKDFQEIEPKYLRTRAKGKYKTYKVLLERLRPEKRQRTA